MNYLMQGNLEEVGPTFTDLVDKIFQSAEKEIQLIVFVF